MRSQSSQAMGIHPPAAKRAPPGSRGFQPPYQPTLRVIRIDDSDTEEDSDVSDYSGGTSEYWTVTCPRCMHCFTTGAAQPSQAVASESALGTSEGLDETGSILSEDGDQSTGTLGDGIEHEQPRTQDGLGAGDIDDPIRIEDD